ncbi:glycosyl-4,4'-diaponeurosporenoate acyltransferase [Staphylococcus petrasii]|uniref:glycosyl-4,4'-diaponeurosporenoate acyltransferase CrtO family protein n=1 Tax=Staphylococcus petrasii TaxID=1276936 RepID=UPI001F565800|nr:glycosyl-4,4'-diaponeurosporenoate acyltransferase [Staphylococcus petrasii]MCI2774320.1 glycosyl-4,4'-diaponeurosporenoate acyltransferase [Staphylococcus petrasii]
MTFKKLLKLGIFHSIYWFTTQMVLASVGTKLPHTFFTKYSQLFKSFSWEKEGKIWNDLFKINKWKHYIPEGSQLNQNIYNKKQLTSFNLNDLHTMIIEMRRAEFVHWLSMLPVLAFLKVPTYIKIINVSYVILANLPIIITQRYNRPRLEKVYQLKLKRGAHRD